MTPSTLFTVDEGGIATLTMNEPARLNPLTEGIQQGLLDALSRVEQDAAIRALILTGSGKGFCVGADLDQFAEWAQGAGAPGTPSLGKQVAMMMEKNANRIIRGFKALPVPVVCAVNGPAVGGGFGLSLAGDMVIAGRSAYFYLPFVPALGIVPDMGASWLLPRLVGSARAMALSLLGERLSAERAAEWGLIWACVDDVALQGEARKLARRLAALPAHAVQEMRALQAASEQNTLSAQLALEASRQGELIDGESFAEGLAAFQGKRKPVFKPRG